MKTKRKHSKVTFKPYQMDQLMLLPPSLDELIPEDHPVRVVSAVVDRIDMKRLVKAYKGGGTSSYHPKMMIKVIVYAYSQGMFSCRQMEKALEENIHFMWLSGGNRPDHRTINRFRSDKLKGLIKDVFTEILILLAELGHVKLEGYFVDGTKIEANANRYTYVWRKNTERYKKALEEKIKELFEEIDRINEAEDEAYGDCDLEETESSAPIDSKTLKARIEEIGNRLNKEPEKAQQLKKASRVLEKEYLPRLERYEKQERKLAGRNSYSKTDPDATFMRMKEDYMGNGQLKPAYNVQIGTENQFVVGFSIHQSPADTACLIPHLEHVKEQLGRYPADIIADAGYGSEENYEYLEERGLGNYVKYNTFDQEQKHQHPKRFVAETWPHDADTDTFICPAGRRLTYRGTEDYRTQKGYLTERRVYESEDCSGCTLRSQCTRARGNRQIRISFRLRELKAKAKENLCSEKGIRLRARRMTEPESVFGRLKGNWGFRRFLLRGIEKVTVEWGLLCIAHNLTRLAAITG